MDPRDLEEALTEYKDCEEQISLLEKEDPLTLFYIKKSHLQHITEAVENTRDKIVSLEAVVQDRQPEEDNSKSKSNKSSTKSTRRKAKSLRTVVTDHGARVDGQGVSKTEQEFLTSINRLVRIIT